MAIEPNSLNIPLRNRQRNTPWIFVACAALAWWWHQPTQLPAIAISCVVGGFAFWCALGPGLNRFKHHGSFIVRWASFVGSIALVFLVMQFLIPWLHRCFS